jgi:NAD(P)-dependent dehydrogenase (short-subunit alcohol dehydrogenase family)
VDQRLQGKRAIVTGGGSGIGRGAVLKLAAEGASVAILDVNLEAAQRVVLDVLAEGGKAIALGASVTDESAVADAISVAEERFGGLDTIIANAGVMLFDRDTIATELSLETWQRCIDINLTGMFLTCKHGLRALQRNGSGSVVITASPTGTYGCAPTFTAYSTSKAGTLGLMRILAVDYVKKNIRVNAVLPGTTNSPLVAKLMENPGTRAEFLAKIPMARAADAEEIANVIAFLASDEASYVTGAAWYADGGLTAI